MNAETAEIPYLNQVLKWNDTLLGLPALPLVLLGCIVFGYVLKSAPVVRNRWIPFGVICFGIGANIFIKIPTSVELGARAVIYGMVVGVLSIVIHRKWLRDRIDARWFSDTDDDKPNNTDPPKTP